jgi:glycosidase
MKQSLSPQKSLLLFVLLVASSSLVAGRLGHAAIFNPQATDAPEVLKVEPPNWWIGHSINPVRVMIRGHNLAGARVEAAGAGLQIGLTRINERGTYLFVDVLIDPQDVPGPRQLRIITERGTATAPFEILAPLPRAGRFQGFSPDDVIYLIMPDRFANGDPTNDDPLISRGMMNRQKKRYYHGGDLQGIINRLPYLKDLGVTALWLNPVYDNVNHLNEREVYDEGPITDYHGYGAVDFYAVDEHFGDVAKFRELVDAAHRLGIKVIQDQVANHSGPYHPWVKDSPTPTWYNGTEAQHLNETWQTWTLMDPHATPQVQKETLDGWFINILPDLNQNDEETARYIIQNTLWWIGISGLDGIRQDTLPYVPRRFWREWMAAIKREYPRLTVVGELFDGNPALVSFFQGGESRFDGVDSRIDTLFDFPLFFPLRRAFAEGKPIREVAIMLAHDHLYVNPNLLVTFLGLHDVQRFMSEPGASLAGLKLAFTLLMTTRGIPMIYYGDEIAMPGGHDPDNRRDFPGGWPGDPRNAFEESGRTPDEQAVFAHVRRLTRRRAEWEPLRRGSLVNLHVTEQTYAYARVTDRDSVIVVFNNGTQPTTVEFNVGPVRLSEGATLKDQFGVAPDVRVQGGKISVALPARSAAIYQ